MIEPNKELISLVQKLVAEANYLFSVTISHQYGNARESLKKMNKLRLDTLDMLGKIEQEETTNLKD